MRLQLHLFKSTLKNVFFFFMQWKTSSGFSEALQKTLLNILWVEKLEKLKYDSVKESPEGGRWHNRHLGGQAEGESVIWGTWGWEGGGGAFWVRFCPCSGSEGSCGPDPEHWSRTNENVMALDQAPEQLASVNTHTERHIFNYAHRLYFQLQNFQKVWSENTQCIGHLEHRCIYLLT